MRFILSTDAELLCLVQVEGSAFDAVSKSRCGSSIATGIKLDQPNEVEQGLIDN